MEKLFYSNSEIIFPYFLLESAFLVDYLFIFYLII
jgi:hypothetical protein